MIQETLKKLGFNEKEVAIYLEALRLGRATPAKIAKNTGINRTTIYSASKALIKKGVIAEDIGNKYSCLVALPINNLKTIIEQQKQLLLKKEGLIAKALIEFTELPINTQFSVPKIRFVEEADLEKFLYTQTDNWNKSIKQKDSTWWGFQDHTFIDKYKKWVLDYWIKFESSKNIKEKVLTNQTEAEKQIINKSIVGRKTVFWDKSANFSSSFWIGGDYVIMIYTQNHPFYLIEIYNPVMAHNLREVFKNLWEEINN